MSNQLIQWLDERTGIPTVCGKIRSWTVPGCRCCCRFLPSMIIFAFVLQAITGVFLWAYYSPSAQSAWESLFYMQFVLPGGWMIRGIHHFSAQLLTALLGIYILGLVFRGAYRSPREFVFWTAVVLFLFSLASSLTGDLLSWTLSGFSATLVRVRFLQMIPFVGESLFRIVAGGTEFGTLTLPRFLVLHILVFGGGFFAFILLWRFFDYRAGLMADASTSSTKTNSKACARVPFWSGELLKCSLAWLVVMGVVLLLVYQRPILHTIRPDTFSLDTTLPPEASRGVHVGAPADPASFYDAARPEWSFRALYHFCNLKVKGAEGEIDLFPGDKKYIPVFVVTGCLMLYIFLIPLIGRWKIGHYFNLLAVLVLFLGVSYLTYASYHHDYIDPSMADFRADEAKAERLAKRTIELCLAPEGIPPTGALTLLARDPYLQGPELYERHCAVCHPFAPMNGEPEHPDFKPIPCETPKAPNLYNPIRKEWVSGFLDAKRIKSDDYFGKTKFNDGRMVGYLRNELKEIMSEDEEENEQLLDKLIDLLVDDARRDGPRKEADGKVEGLDEDQLDLFPTFNCGQCHNVYGQKGKPVIQAPDLRGYMSRDWMIGIIADPTDPRFYGPSTAPTQGNDAMPSFHLPPDDVAMSPEEIGTLVDWLRGKWYRYEKRTPEMKSVEAPAKDAVSEKSDGASEFQPLTPLTPAENPPTIPAG